MTGCTKLYKVREREEEEGKKIQGKDETRNVPSAMRTNSAAVSNRNFPSSTRRSSLPFDLNPPYELWPRRKEPGEEEEEEEEEKGEEGGDLRRGDVSSPYEKSSIYQIKEEQQK